MSRPPPAPDPLIPDDDEQWLDDILNSIHVHNNDKTSAILIPHIANLVSENISESQDLQRAITSPIDNPAVIHHCQASVVDLNSISDNNHQNDWPPVVMTGHDMELGQPESNPVITDLMQQEPFQK